MKISRNGIDLIKEFEGFMDKAYLCQAGKWTIGYGHTSGVKEGDTCTKEQAEDYLKSDLTTFERVINNVVKVQLNQNQYDAICSFIFNVGIGSNLKPGFTNSTMLKFINEGHIPLAAGQFDRWIYVKGQVSNGLKKRRKKEKELFLK